jgi:hypothetical protein
VAQATEPEDPWRLRRWRGERYQRGAAARVTRTGRRKPRSRGVYAHIRRNNSCTAPAIWEKPKREKPNEGRFMGIVALTAALVHPFATEVARYPLE